MLCTFPKIKEKKIQFTNYNPLLLLYDETNKRKTLPVSPSLLLEMYIVNSIANKITIFRFDKKLLK